ncbi:hypothetical protein F444_23086, partial [Phytophthora nicotianae P1976]
MQAFESSQGLCNWQKKNAKPRVFQLASEGQEDEQTGNLHMQPLSRSHNVRSCTTSLMEIVKAG